MPFAEGPSDQGLKHQLLGRVATVLDAVARHGEQGARFADIVTETGLSKATAHRLLGGLRAEGMLERGAGSSRYRIGSRVAAWASRVQFQSSLARRLAGVLDRICRETEDTVYLTMRRGAFADYIDRREGTHPLKALPVGIGERRPLGIGAGPMAILAGLTTAERAAVMSEVKVAAANYPASLARLDRDLATTINDGFSFNAALIVPGLCAIGVAFVDPESSVEAAVSVAATADRLARDRRGRTLGIIRGALGDAGLLHPLAE